jgi:exopolyphosphatase/guanosine-5'-triphosphate,3'-diphosphate pyrophosphatase
MARTPRFPLRIAAIDIGSNAMRAFAVEFTSVGKYRQLLSDRAPVRLGHSVFLAGAIARDDMEAAIAALGNFRVEVEALGVRHLRAVATSAVREAGNKAEFVRRARREAGVEVEPISGAEEGRLLHLAVSKRMAIEKPILLVDLGGGSLEVSLADRRGILWSESHPVGAVRLLEEFRQSKGNAKKFQKLIEESVGAFRMPASGVGRRPVALAATGGNMEDTWKLLGGKESQHVGHVTVSALETLAARLAKMSLQDRVRKLGMRPDRADVILPALYIHIHLARLAGLKQILVPRVGVKEGVVWDLLDSVAIHTNQAERRAELVRDGAIALGRRFQFEEGHGVQVGRLAVTLFDQLRDLHGLGAEEREILVAAAILHDVGRFIGDRAHHKHSYYLISQSDLPGLGPRELELAAQVARYHRRSEPATRHEPYRRLHPTDRDRVERLAAVLRLADALDREHRGAVDQVRARRRDGRLVLELKGAKEHGQRHDFLLEQWAVQQKGDLFTRLWGLPVEVRKA